MNVVEIIAARLFRQGDYKRASKLFLQVLEVEENLESKKPVDEEDYVCFLKPMGYGPRHSRSRNWYIFNEPIILRGLVEVYRTPITMDNKQRLLEIIESGIYWRT